MDVYCVREKRFTPNVLGSETYATTKNGRRQLKVKCASCGITKTRFIPMKGGALSSRRGPSTVDKIAYVASNFVTPAPSFTAAAKILGSQALKGVTDNVNYFRRGGGDYDMRNYAGNRVDDPTNPLYERPRGRGFDLHKAIGKLPKPKKGWTLPGHNYTGPYNPLDKQLTYDPKTGKILKIYQQPTGTADAVSMQHDVDYAVCAGKKNEKSCKHDADKKMVKALDAIPKNKRQWGHAAARNAIASKRKMGLGVGETINKNVGDKIPGFQTAQDLAAALMASTGGDKDLFKKYWSGDIAKGAFNTKTGLFSKKFWTHPAKDQDDGTCNKVVYDKKSGKFRNMYCD